MSSSFQSYDSILMDLYHFEFEWEQRAKFTKVLGYFL